MAADDLATFLLARLDEDVEVAIRENTWPNGRTKTDANWANVAGQADSLLVAMFSPARVLADCAAKRAVVEVLAKQAAACPPDDWPEDGEIMKAPLADNARHLLRLLVQPYSGHPHFHPSWAVD